VPVSEGYEVGRVLHIVTHAHACARNSVAYAESRPDAGAARDRQDLAAGGDEGEGAGGWDAGCGCAWLRARAHVLHGVVRQLFEPLLARLPAEDRAEVLAGAAALAMPAAQKTVVSAVAPTEIGKASGTPALDPEGGC
jgi:hypothetical protein